MIRVLAPIFALLFALSVASAANITWDPENGYQSDEVELSGCCRRKSKEYSTG